MQEPQTLKIYTVNCSLGSVHVSQSQTDKQNPTPLELDSICSSSVTSYVENHPSHTSCGSASAGIDGDLSTDNGLVIKVSYYLKNFYGQCISTRGSTTYNVGSSLGDFTEVEECSDGLLNYNDASGGLTCYSSIDATNNDTCNYNDVYSNPVTESVACVEKNDKSMCAVSAVDIGDGNQVYMPTENDCYSDVYPILDENGGIGDMPNGSDQQCTESGALSYCPADPEEKCPNGQCEAGCGYMNDQFICVAPTQPPEPPECTGDDCGTEPPPCTGDDCGTGTGTETGECPAGDTTCGNGGGTQPCEAGSSDCIPCEAGDTSCSLVKGEKGSYDMEAAEAELLAIKEELQNKIDTIKSESSTLIPEINGGTASFNSCFDVISFQGRKENRCLTEYADEMEIISKIMLFIFTVLSGFIVLSGVTKT